jgi:hypothetical protein
MGTIYGSLFQRAMSTGLTNEPFQVILEQGDGTNFNANDNVVKSRPAQDWTQNTGGDETKIAVTDFDGSISGWGEWEAASDNSDAGQFRVQINDASLTMSDFLLFDGGDFPVTASNGQVVTPQSFPAALDLVRQGVAEVMFNGDNNLSYKYTIYNGSGTALKTLTPSDSNHVAYTYDGNANAFQLSGDLTFENNSSSSWQVEEVKVFETGGGNMVTQSTGVSVGVANNGSITFTKIENDIQGLT